MKINKISPHQRVDFQSGKIKRWLLVGAIYLLCLNQPAKASVTTIKCGLWRATLEMQGLQMPFNFEVVHDQTGGYDIYLINAEERLLLDEVVITGDTVNIVMHIFDADIKARISGDSLHGVFIKNYETNYHLPFVAVFGQHYRFSETVAQAGEVEDFSGKYSVQFINEFDTTQAVGIFRQDGNAVTGTFLTATGDYRYLQGNVVNGYLKLSTFDGNHAYLFTASKRPDGKLVGEFYAGKTWTEFWTAERNDAAALPDPESLTYLKTGYDKIEFTFPDVYGKSVSLHDKKYKNKVVILQLFGTWCPNCMDETIFMADWYKKNKHRGVVIIGLAYERKDNFVYASNRVKKMIEKLAVTYDFVIAGSNDKEKAAQTLPMLNSVIAFPTTIFIGKDGKVKKTHTGFSGPGTGIYYDQFIERFNETINTLLNEHVTASK